MAEIAPETIETIVKGGDVDAMKVAVVGDIVDIATEILAPVTDEIK